MSGNDSGLARSPAADLLATRIASSDPVEARIAALAWCSARAERLSILIDAADYFAALDDALECAERSIRIMGWDLDTRVPLRPGHDPRTFGERILDLLERRRELHVHCLIWQLIGWQASNRELPPFNPEWTSHPRIHFRYDTERPLESSRHEKLVVIDDALAFMGCTDISRERWDVQGHGPEVEHLRVNADGEPYRPHHDLQAIMDGEAAERLAEHFANAWQKATGERPQAPPRELRASDRWPVCVPVDVRGVLLHFARTAPPFESAPAIDEIRRTVEAVIAAARELLYIEMQYLTATAVTNALCARLASRDPPRVLLVLPEHANTLIERRVMHPMQNEQLCRLLEHDRHDRLRITFPTLPPGHGELMLHSKLTIADDDLLLLGSANFNQRSMSVDNEIGFTLWAKDVAERAAIARIRHRLLAEFLGTHVDELAADTPAALFERIARSAGAARGLHPYRIERDPDGSETLIDSELADPVALYGALEMTTLNLDAGQVRKRLWTGLAGIAAACVALALLWTLTPAEDLFRDWLVAQGGERSALSIAGVVLALIAASLVMMPITLITVVCFVLLGPWLGMAAALCVSLGSAAIGFGLGRWLDERWLDRLAGSKIDTLKQKLNGAAHGVTLVVAIRFMPIAPFTAVNLAIGAAGIRFRHFMLGSFIGLLPGKLLIAIFADRALQLIENPTWQSALVAAAVAAVTIGVAWLGTRWLERRSGGGQV